MKLDWKYIAILLATLAGVAVPVGLWQADQSSKSLSIKLAARISIQPKEQGAISGIEILVDGIRLVNPHLVVFEIQNNGSKPILSADYESPVQINVVSETKFVRSNITGKTPKDIDVILVTGLQGISVKPTLLNPGDTISVTAITSGDPPTFQSKARIVGIANVVLEDGTTKRPSKIKLVILLLGSVLSFIIFWLMSESVVNENGVLLRRRAAAFVGIVAFFAAATTQLMFLDEAEIQGFWYYMLYYLILMIPASVLASVLNRSRTAAARNGVGH